jgi:hypothetical protein
MTATTTITDVLNKGITLRTDEALAIAQKLIHQRRSATPQQPFGPPTPDNVDICEDGSVACRACDVTPAVSEIAIFLETLLSRNPASVPDGLTAAIARALLEVDAPPFDSVEVFSEALARFEQEDRSTVVHGLVQRVRSKSESMAVMPSRSPVVQVPVRDRRHSTPSVEELRRELRLADVLLYEQRHAMESRAASRRVLRRTGSMAASIAAVMALTAGSGRMMHRGNAAEPAPRPSPMGVAVTTTVPPALPATPVLPATPLDRELRPVAAAQIPVPKTATALPAARHKPSKRRAVQSARAGSSDGAGRQNRLGAGNDERRNRHAPATGVLARLRLQWLRNVFSSRSDL